MLKEYLKRYLEFVKRLKIFTCIHFPYALWKKWYIINSERECLCHKMVTYVVWSSNNFTFIINSKNLCISHTSHIILIYTYTHIYLWQHCYTWILQNQETCLFLKKENENSNVKVIEVAAPCSVKGEKTTY